jgi:hypothetical protein
MSSRGPIVWYLGLIALAIVPAVLAVVLIWDASGTQIRVDEFYTSQQGGDTVTEEEYRYWDGLMRGAYQQTTVVAPTLLTGAVVAVFTLLAVIAFRWERRRRQSEAVVAP